MPAHRKEPTPEQLAELPRLTTVTAAHRFGVSAHTIVRWRRDYAIPSPLSKRILAEQPEPEDEVAPVLPAQTWTLPEGVALDSGLWRTLETLQQQMGSLDPEVREVDVALPDDGPVLVVFSSDWHCGHTACDLSLLRRDLELVRNTPGVRAILGGDLIDNVVTSVATRGSYHEQLTPLRIQRHLVDEAVAYMGADNVLALVLGNHDAWSIRDVDYDPIAYLAAKTGAPYLGAFGFVNLALGSQRYRILAGHQFRMRSSFNRTHQAKRMEDFVGDADVVFTGHTHEGAMEATDRRGRKRVYGQSGSYLRSSRYGRSLGFTDAGAAMAGVILFPERHKLIGVGDAFDEGVALLRALRA